MGNNIVCNMVMFNGQADRQANDIHSVGNIKITKMTGHKALPPNQIM